VSNKKESKDTLPPFSLFRNCREEVFSETRIRRCESSCVRMPGDAVFIIGGVLPLLYICYLGVRYTIPHTTMEEPEDILFTEITEPETAGSRER
jgi:hypothetical protein